MAAAYDAKVAIDGVVRDAAEAQISPLTEGVMFGRGLFETIKVIAGRPVFLNAHSARLAASCSALGMPRISPLASLRDRCEQLLLANDRADGVLKVMVLAGANASSEIITSRGAAYSSGHYERGFRLNLQRDPVRRVAPAHKTTSYLPNLLAREQARARGADDALFVDDSGWVLEGSATNVFAVVGGQLLTPPLTEGVLPGIARGEILRRCAARGAKEHRLSAEMLRSADEVFVTNALLGVMPVSAVDDHVYRLREGGATRELMRDFAAWQASSASAT